MSDLANHVDEYLRMRRSFGFKLVFPGRVLPEFVAHVEAAGTDTITVELAIEWAGSSDAAPIVLSH
ncbi:MAG: integrase, partial [Candidatus Microthrix parvicella]